MYQENNVRINWVKIFLKVLIVFLVVILSVKVLSLFVNETNVKESNSNISDNLQIMNKVARDYYDDKLLPEEIGDSNKVSLKALIDEEKIDNLKDINGKKCNYDKSYIVVTKLDKKYQYKSYLECGNESDTFVSFKDIKEKVSTTKEQTTTTTTTKETTKKTTKKTTTKKVIKTTKRAIQKEKTYEVSFNVNGGEYIDSQIVNENNKIKNVIPVREGYTFIGWFYHGQPFDLNKPINQDYVLVAKWSKN